MEEDTIKKVKMETEIKRKRIEEKEKEVKRLRGLVALPKKDETHKYVQLCEAARQGKKVKCDELLKTRLNINGKDIFGNTPLIEAANNLRLISMN